MGKKLKAIIFICVQGYLLRYVYAATKAAAQNKVNANTPPNSTLSYEFEFKVSVGLPYDQKNLRRKEFEQKLTDAYKNSPGFNYIKIVDFPEGTVLTCRYKAFYHATEKIAVIKQNVLNNVIARLKQESFYVGGTLYNFDVNYGEMQVIVQQTLGGPGKRLLCRNFISPCAREYTCEDDPYFICKHRCQYGAEKLSCNNDGQCFVDLLTNTTKCSCGESDMYTYSGTHCDGKALKMTYTIAIVGGAAGGVILLMIIVIVVLCVHGSSKSKKKDPKINESIYMDTFNQPGGSRAGQGSRMSLDGVSNELYSAEEFKFLAGRNHTVVKDNRGQEIYLYKPVPSEKSPSRRTSTDMDAASTRPSSYHGSYTGNTQYEVKRHSLNYL